MPTGLVVPRALYDEVIAHCQSRYPKEACGMLASSTVAGASAEAAAAIYPMRNVEDSPIGYSMDPKEQLQVEKQMRQKQQRVLAIYHSHTASDAHPSSVDVSLAISPDLYYVLVSLKDRQKPVFRAFRIDGQTITEYPWSIGDTSFLVKSFSEKDVSPSQKGCVPEAVDVRDMLCAQAVARVDRQMQSLAPGAVLAVLCNTTDVVDDVAAWAKARGHHLVSSTQDGDERLLQFRR